MSTYYKKLENINLRSEMLKLSIFFKELLSSWIILIIWETGLWIRETGLKSLSADVTIPAAPQA